MATTTFHEYDGNGSNKDFNYTFPTYASTEVKVLVDQVLVDNWTIVSWSASGTNTVRFDKLNFIKFSTVKDKQRYTIDAMVCNTCYPQIKEWIDNNPYRRRVN